MTVRSWKINLGKLRDGFDGDQKKPRLAAGLLVLKILARLHSRISTVLTAADRSFLLLRQLGDQGFRRQHEGCD